MVETMEIQILINKGFNLVVLLSKTMVEAEDVKVVSWVLETAINYNQKNMVKTTMYQTIHLRK